MPVDDAPIEVTLDLPHPADHLVDVTMRLPAMPERMARTLLMPRWVPGSYSLRDFARFVQDLDAVALPGRGGRDKERRLEVRRERTDGWTFDVPAHTEVELRYRVYCRDLTVQSSHLTQDHATLVPATLVLYDEQVRSRPWRLTLTVPKEWGIWSGMPLEGTGKASARGKPEGGSWPSERRGRAVFLAEDYDHLIDCPIETGCAHHEIRFRAAGKAHRVVVWQPPKDVDWDRMGRDLTALVEETVALFGTAPYKDYTFIIQCALGHGGGLEHRNSTVLGVEPIHLTDPKEYQKRFLPLAAHEFFHTWNVKRILPERFVPYDYQSEVLTSLLWLFEGATSYYETPLLNRAKLLDDDHRYHDLQELVKFLDLVPGRHRITVADASRLSWTKLYRRHESNINTNVSYYSKGALVCLCLDAHLRERGASLDDVFRYLWEHYGSRGIGVPEDGVPELVQAATGVDLKRQMRAWIDRPGDLPIERSLRLLGLKMERKHSDGDNKHGFGIMLEDDATDRIVVRAVSDRWKGAERPGRALDRADVPVLSPGDELVAVDGWKVTQKTLGKALSVQDPKRPVEVTLFREGRLHTLPVPLLEKQKDKVTIKVDKSATAAQKRRRNAWERGRARRKSSRAGGSGRSGGKNARKTAKKRKAATKRKGATER